MTLIFHRPLPDESIPSYDEPFTIPSYDESFTASSFDKSFTAPLPDEFSRKVTIFSGILLFFHLSVTCKNPSAVV